MSVSHFELRYADGKVRDRADLLAGEAIYVGPCDNPASKQVRKLITFTGGELVQSLGMATLCITQEKPGGEFLDETLNKHTEASKHLQRLINDSSVLMTDWLFDAIGSGKLPTDRNHYALNSALAMDIAV